MEQLRADQAALAEELMSVQQRLTELRVTGTCPDGLVAVTVDGRARVVEFDLDPAVYRRSDTAWLAGQLLEAFHDAEARAAEAAHRLAVQTLGAGRVRIDDDPAFDPVRALLNPEGPR